MMSGAVRKKFAKLECGHVVIRVVLNCVEWTMVEFGEEITLRRAKIEVLPFMLCRKQVWASRTRDAYFRTQVPDNLKQCLPT